VGIAREGWTLEQLKARARKSVEEYGGHDPAAFENLSKLLLFVAGDYTDPATFQKLRTTLGDAKHPAHYLAIPPVLFAKVIEQLGVSSCSKGARVIVEKPFGTDLESARRLNAVLLAAFDEDAIFRIDHY